ncbi:hypothetical protein Btru_066392 [Bulinus truncatus]|nr:hypothetical protein Btru_066392 [Bulinus truncatus]
MELSRCRVQKSLIFASLCLLLREVQANNRNASETDGSKSGTSWVELGTDRFGHLLPCKISTQDDLHEGIDVSEDREKVNLFEFQVKLKDYTFDPFKCDTASCTSLASVRCVALPGIRRLEVPQSDLRPHPDLHLPHLRTLFTSVESAMCHLYYGSVIDGFQTLRRTVWFFCEGTRRLKKRSVIVTWGFCLTILVHTSSLYAGYFAEDNDFISYPFSSSSWLLVGLIAVSLDVMAFFLPIASFFILYSMFIEVVISEFDDTANEMGCKSRHQALCHIVIKLSKLTRLNGSEDSRLVWPLYFWTVRAKQWSLSQTYVFLEVTIFMWTLIPVLVICVVWGCLPNAVMGTIVTYGIVVIQFQRDNGDTVNCHVNSSLNVSTNN